MNNPVDGFNINYHVFLINHHVSQKSKTTKWLTPSIFRYGVNETSSGNNMIFGRSPTKSHERKTDDRYAAWDFGSRKTVLLTTSAAGRHPRDVVPFILEIYMLI